MDTVAPVDVAVVIPNYNGARWLPAVLASVAAQTTAPAEVLVVDDGSTDGSLALLAARFPDVRVLALASTAASPAPRTRASRPSAEAVALVNTDVVLAPDWLERAAAALTAAPRAAAVATKLSTSRTRRVIYDAGDVLRRDGACEQRGRFERDSGRYDAPGEVFSACAGAALYRRAAVLDAGGFEERFGTYLEDVDLGLRLRLAGWRCRWEPRAVARHAGGGSSAALRHGPGAWVERNTLLLVARAFPARWLQLVAYRQLAWAWHAARAGELRAHLAGHPHGAAAAPRVPARAPRVARGGGGQRRGSGPAAPDPRAARRRPSVAPCRAERAGVDARAAAIAPLRSLAAPSCRSAAVSPRSPRPPCCRPGAALAQSAGDEQYEDPFARRASSGAAGGRSERRRRRRRRPRPPRRRRPRPRRRAAPAGPRGRASRRSSRSCRAPGSTPRCSCAAGAVLLAGGLVLRSAPA